MIKKEQKKLSDIYYEKMMFEKMYRRLKSDSNIKWDLENAILESFLMHTRNLIDFLRGTKKEFPYKSHCTDIIKSDFRGKNGENLDLVKKWNINKKDKERINVMLAHLSEKRLDLEKDWFKEIEIFKNEVMREFNKFVDEISEEYFSFRVAEQLIRKKDLKINPPIILGKRENEVVTYSSKVYVSTVQVEK